MIRVASWPKFFWTCTYHWPWNHMHLVEINIINLRGSLRGCVFFGFVLQLISKKLKIKNKTFMFNIHTFAQNNEGVWKHLLYQRTVRRILYVTKKALWWETTWHQVILGNTCWISSWNREALQVLPLWGKPG